MRKYILSAIILISILSNTYSQQTNGTFTLGNKEFLLNGKPFIIRAAELHYPRIPKEYWEHRIQLSKAMGMNTVCIYLFWNLHEQQPGVYDFTGQNDVAEFVKLVQKNSVIHQESSVTHQEGSVTHQESSVTHQEGSVIHQESSTKLQEGSTKLQVSPVIHQKDSVSYYI